MYIKLATIAISFFLLACNNTKENDSNAPGTSTSVSTNDDDDAKPAGDIEAQKAALNKQSKACIALMNALEPEMNAAYAAGDAATAQSIKARIDSAAMENVKIGQQLMALGN